MKKLSLFLAFVFLTNLNAYKIGDKVSEDIANKINLTNDLTIVDFFASWCVSCKHELPLVSKLSENTQEAKFIGIDSDEEVEEGMAFQKELKLAFPVVNDSKQQVVSAFNPIGMPSLYYIKNKKIVKILSGAIDNIDNVIKKDIKSLK